MNNVNLCFRGAVCSKAYEDMDIFCVQGGGGEGAQPYFKGVFPPYKRVSYITNLSTKQLVPTDAGG